MSGQLRNRAELKIYQRMCALDPIMRSSGSRKTTCSHSPWKESVLCSGVPRTQARLIARGKKREFMRTLKIHAPSSGTVTEDKSMLSSMSSLEMSPSPIYSRGSTSTRLSLKPRVAVNVSAPSEFGSPVMWIHDNGMLGPLVPSKLKRL